MRTAASSMERSFQIKKEVTSTGEQAELCRTWKENVRVGLVS